MASGTPVITSNVSSLPEVVGDAALLIDPLDPNEIAQAIRRVLWDSDLREDLKQRGLRRVKDFSWERSVRRGREIYGEGLGEGASPWSPTGPPGCVGERKCSKRSASSIRTRRSIRWFTSRAACPSGSKST